MRFFQNMRRIRAFMAEDIDLHIGDIALLKLDSVGLDIRPELRSHLDPVRGWAPRLDLPALRALPANSFGHAYAAFLDHYKLAPIVLTSAIDAETLARNAYGLRYATTHDMFHALLGFAPDPVGEMGVLAFTCGQGFHRVLWIQALFAWLVYPFQSGFKLGALRAAWRRGYTIGRRAPLLLGLKLEDRFEEDLSALREELDLADPEPARAAA